MAEKNPGTDKFRELINSPFDLLKRSVYVSSDRSPQASMFPEPLDFWALIDYIGHTVCFCLERSANVCESYKV